MKNGNLCKGKLEILCSKIMQIGEKFAVFSLVFCLFASNMPYGTALEVHAEGGMLTENVEIDGVVYKEIEPGKMQLVEWKNEIQVNEEIRIPETVTYGGKDYTVASIGDSVFAYQYLGKVTFPDTIESIGQEAFRACGTLQMAELTLPPNLKEIGNSAFWCSQIKGELEIPDSVSRIGDQAFRETQISSVVISNPNIAYGSSVFAYNANLASIQLPEGMASLGGGYFLWGCRSLAQIDIPESVTSIPEAALRECTQLTEIQIPVSVNKIGSSAFFGCTGVREIVIPEGVTEIPIWMLRNCSEELCVTLPDSITFIHNGAFWDTNAEKEKYSQSVTVKCTSRVVAARMAGIGHKNILLNDERYEQAAFNKDGYTYTVTDNENKYVQLDTWEGTRPSGEVTIPETIAWEGNEYTVKTIGENAFEWCSDITRITLPDTLAGMGTRAFWNCKKLESINLPDGITRIEQMTFYNCPLLTDLTLPGELKYIGVYAFGKCAGLQKIVIPGSCSIDTGAFDNCTGITEVTLCEGIAEMGSNIFCNCTSIKEIRLPDSMRKIGGYAFQDCTELEEITLNRGLTEIGVGIFKGCGKLTGTMILPDSVTTIRQDAFVDSSLSGIHVGSGLTILESGAFPDTIRLMTNSLEVWKLLSENTNRENAPVFVWDGTCDVPDGMYAYVEGSIVINGSATIGEGAVVTIMHGASLTIDNGGTLTNNGSIEGEGAFTVNGLLIGTGTLGEGMQMAFLLTEDMVADVGNAVYCAEPIVLEPEVSVMIGERKTTFEKDVDFTYSYANNTNPGRADITVTPKEGGKLMGQAVTKYFMIGKAEQAAPAACNLTFTENEDKQTFTATIERTEGAEYSFDGETWTDGNTKSDCQPNTAYTAYIRMKETDTHFASDVVKATLKSPGLKGNEGNTGVTENQMTAPEILKLKAIAGRKGISVQVTVKPVAGAERYEIYRISGKKTTLVKTTLSGKTQIQDEKPVQSAKYYAVAVTKDGSVKSAAGTVKAIRLAKGTKIKKVLSTSKGIKITWKKGKSAKKYVLYRSAKKNSGYVRVKTLGKKKLSYVDKKAKKGKKYYYRIAVITKSNPSPMSTASKRVKRR